MRGWQGGVAQGHHDPVARLALRVAIGLQQLEALARGGLFAPKEHDPQFGGWGRVRNRYYFYSPYKTPFFENRPNEIKGLVSPI